MNLLKKSFVVLLGFIGAVKINVAETLSAKGNLCALQRESCQSDNSSFDTLTGLYSVATELKEIAASSEEKKAKIFKRLKYELDQDSFVAHYLKNSDDKKLISEANCRLAMTSMLLQLFEISFDRHITPLNYNTNSVEETINNIKALIDKGEITVKKGQIYDCDQIQSLQSKQINLKVIARDTDDDLLRKKAKLDLVLIEKFLQSI